MTEQELELIKNKSRFVDAAVDLLNAVTQLIWTAAKKLEEAPNGKPLHR